jgi:hypothetical protein
MSTEKQAENTGRDEHGRFTKDAPTAFKPGQSGNPAGRPKSITLSEAIRLQLAQTFNDSRTYAEEIALVLCVTAAKGNVNAAREIADRTEGKPTTRVDLDMRVNDWRTLASQHGLSEQDVIREARLLVEQSATDSGDA